MAHTPDLETLSKPKTKEGESSPLLSVVVCVYNEAGNIKALIDKTYQALDGIDFELIYVDDGSTDDTLKNIRDFSRPGMKLVELRKNYGQSNALAAGIDESQGTYIALMDGDLQNDPIDIPKLIEQLVADDVDVVAGIRANRKDDMLLRKIPSSLANFIIRRATGIHIKDAGCTLKAFKSDIAKGMGLYGELHRFIPVLASLEGAKISQREVTHHERSWGNSKYGIGRTFKVVSDLMLMVFFQKYLSKPMHLFGASGLFLFTAGAIINFYLLALKLMGGDIWGKPLLILGLILVLGGIQLITTGIIAEILMRIYYEGQRKTPYQLRNVQTF